jgi:hypothetical protein
VNEKPIGIVLMEIVAVETGKGPVAQRYQCGLFKRLEIPLIDALDQGFALVRHEKPIDDVRIDGFRSDGIRYFLEL